MEKKVLNIVILLLVLSIVLFVLTGCYKQDENSDLEQNTITERLVTLDDTETNIRNATQKYYEELFGERISTIIINDIHVYEGTEKQAAEEFVDLDEKDCAFEISFSIEPSNEDDIEEITAYIGKYDEETGLVVEEKGYGVMRYNYVTEGYDVTSITRDSF